MIDDRCPDENNYVPTTVKSRRPADGVTCSNNCFGAAADAADLHAAALLLDDAQVRASQIYHRRRRV